MQTDMQTDRQNTDQRARRSQGIETRFNHTHSYPQIWSRMPRRLVQSRLRVAHAATSAVRHALSPSSRHTQTRATAAGLSSGQPTPPWSMMPIEVDLGGHGLDTPRIRSCIPSNKIHVSSCIVMYFGTYPTSCNVLYDPYVIHM